MHISSSSVRRALAGICLAAAAAWALLLVCATPALAQRPAGDLLKLYRTQHAELFAGFQQSLQKLAADCRQRGLEEAATEVLKVAQPVSSAARQTNNLPRAVQADIPLDLPPDERFWRSQLRRARENYAKELYLLSRRVLNGRSPSYAYDLVREVAYYDPDHRTARRILNFVRNGNEWVTPFEAEMIRTKHVWHEQFGWLPAAHVDRYESGERYFRTRWLSAAQESELRRDFKNAWEVRTEHYLVKTNHSLERGVQLALALEDFYDFFYQTFAGFFSTPEQMQKLFSDTTSGTSRAAERKPYVIHFYNLRDEYLQTLQSRIPQIGITNGLYFTADRVAYFYHDPEAKNDGTLFHEATHQLFYESSKQERPIGDRSDFWIVEGIACYMESFVRENGQRSMGDPRYIRFEAARYRYLVDNYFVPLSRFAAMGMQEFQTDPAISKNYSQASGLAHFFMHYDEGRYRDALVEHLTQLYSDNPRVRTAAASLAELTSTSFGELDRQYGEYIKAQEDSLNTSP